MLKNFFKKINNVIQWSKKYHFFHILAIPSFFYVANIFWFINLLYFAFIIDEKFYGTDYSQGMLGLLMFLMLTIILQMVFIIIALISQIIIFIKHRKRGFIQISSSILLEDKVYNLFYIYTYITLIIVFIFLLLII